MSETHEQRIGESTVEDEVIIVQNGCLVSLVEGHAKRGEPGIPDEDLLHAVKKQQKDIQTRYPHARQVVRAYDSSYIYGNIWENVSKDPMIYTGIDIVDTIHLATSLPKNAKVVQSDSEHAVVHVEWNGPRIQLHRKETLHKANEAWAGTLAQACSYLTRTLGKGAIPSFSWIMEPGGTSGGVLVAMKK